MLIWEKKKMDKVCLLLHLFQLLIYWNMDLVDRVDLHLPTTTSTTTITTTPTPTTTTWLQKLRQLQLKLIKLGPRDGFSYGHLLVWLQREKKVNAIKNAHNGGTKLRHKVIKIISICLVTCLSLLIWKTGLPRKQIENQLFICKISRNKKKHKKTFSKMKLKTKILFLVDGWEQRLVLETA